MAKLAIAVLLVCGGQSIASAHSQQIKLVRKNGSLKEALSDMARQSGYHFLYLEDDMRNAPKISLDLADVPLRDALERVFENTGLTYAIRGKRVIVEKAKLSKMPVASEARSGQQQSEIRGRVTGSDGGQPLAGVTVQNVRGGTTSTDESGEFAIRAQSGDVLLATFLGYKQQRVTVDPGQAYILIRLRPKVDELEEVVAIGYGTQRKADLTGSIASVRADEIAKRPAASAMQSVQGKVAGLNIVASEAPGAAPNVTIRGLGTALGGRNPLYVVDGMPMDGIDNINPADIETMDVLKDASSASIYGLRSANGVVIVRTKKGKHGTAKIGYESRAGMKNVLNRVKMADAGQFRQYFNENLNAIGQTWSLAENQIYETDWYGEILKTGSVFDNAVNLSGGSENMDYFLSFNNLTENGLMEGGKFVRNTVRNNNTYRFLDGKLTLGQTINLTFNERTPKPFGAFNDAYRQSPLVPVFYPNGRSGRPFVNQTTGVVTYESQGGETVGSLNSIGNPVYAVAAHNELRKTVTVQGGLEGAYSITDYLKIHSRIGATKYYHKGRTFSDIKDAWLNADPVRTEGDFDAFKTVNPDATAYANNVLSFGQDETFRWVWENFLTLQKAFGRHNVEATVGMSREKTGIGNRMTAQGYDVPAKEQYWNIDLANSTAASNYAKSVEHTYFTPRALASYFGRAQYNFAGRYYLTATVRRDGSSVFRASGAYWDTFPSFGLGWTLSNERFMQTASWVNLLKIRGSWGILGNQDIPTNVSQIITHPGSDSNNYVFGPGQDLVYGASFGTPVLPLRWEKTRETDIGLDFAILGNQLSGSVDYYRKLNTNTILNVTPTLSSPFSRDFFAHGAKVLNQGLEAVLNWNKSVNEDFRYTVGINYAYNKNEVAEVTPAYDGATGGSLSNGQITKQLRLGQPIYGWWMWETDGVWQNAAEIASGAKTGSPIPGHLRYKDQNGDGVIDNRDKVFFGSYLPTSTYGINIGVNYKALDFSVYGYGVGGNRIYNGLKGTRIDGGENIARATFEQRWTAEGSTNAHPGAARDSYASSYYLESGAYFRINNATLGYTFGRLYSASSKLRLYLSVQNPLIFTKYSGFSPEIATSDGAPQGTTGIELSAYPSTRNFLFGLSVQF